LLSLTGNQKHYSTIVSRMKLVADSGSTKTTWCLIDPVTRSIETSHTSGINPMYQDEDTIYRCLQSEFTLGVPAGTALYFYGAGCINDLVNDIIRKALGRHFHATAAVESDLMAAARSLCRNSEGIACILGTGSNSCYYDGNAIKRQVSPLGYMLGDEGSGAVIGRKFIADLLKNQLPETLGKKFFETNKLTPHAIMDHVYKKPFPNRFLAQFTEFIHDNLHEESMKKLVKNSFGEFFERNIRQYPEAQHLPLNFTGSVAFYFKSLLLEVASESGFGVGTITKSPMEGLINYHFDY